MYCKNCGKEIDNNADICIYCKTPVNSDQPNAVPAQPQKAKNTKTVAIIAAVAAVVVAIAVIFILKSMFSVKAKLKGAYDACCKPGWAYIQDDGSRLVIDANKSQAYEAYIGMQNVNRYLELPQSLTDDIGETNYFSGTQTRTFSSPKVKVTWSYSGTSGLKMVYEAI